jgi:hypothetical protein
MGGDDERYTVESREQLARAAAIPVGRDIEVDGLLQLLNPAVLSA